MTRTLKKPQAPLPPKAKVIHLNFIELQRYFQSKYNLPDGNNLNANREYYDVITLKHHMFRGNDSCMVFPNKFLEERIPVELRSVFNFLDKSVLDFIFNQFSYDDKNRNQQIVNFGPTVWAKAYIELIKNKSVILTSLNKDKQCYYSYMLGGIYESLVMATYKITDYFENHFEKYFWYFSW